MDSLEQDLLKVDLGEIPSPFGELKFELDLEPISQSANSKSKRPLKSKTSQVCSKYQFLLSGDIQVEIQWLVHQRYRYEYHNARAVLPIQRFFYRNKISNYDIVKIQDLISKLESE